MIDDQKCKGILLKIVEDKTKGWSTKPRFDVVCKSLLCAIIATINERRRVQLVGFKKSEIDDYLRNSHFPVEHKIEIRLLQLQRKFYNNK